MPAMVANASALSRSDERILNSVFDPENSPDTPTAKIDESLPLDPCITDPTLLKELRSQELEAVRLVEQFSITSSSQPESLLLNSSTKISTPTHSEDGKRHAIYLQSLEILSTLIRDHSKYASAYNNRAQLRRWRYGESLLESQDAETCQALDAVIDDLDTTIKLASPAKTNCAVSLAQSRLLSQAGTQRGAVFWALSKKSTTDKLSLKRSDGATNQAGLSNEQSSAEWRTWDAMRLEEEGSKSFFMAGMYGSEIGRTMAVKTNPYARLCAGIVKEAMRSEFCA